MSSPTPTPSPLPFLLELLVDPTKINGINNSSTSPSTSLPPTLPPPPSSSSSPSTVLHMRLALTITHLLLVSLGSVNLLVIVVILIRPYMRSIKVSVAAIQNKISITNVYMISLCLADFIYLTNLTLVAATQLNDKSWPFSSALCTLYHGTETTGKYASVMFVVLLAVDRYCAMCKSNWCSRYRNYRTAVLISLAAWLFAALAASPLYYFAEVALLRLRSAPGAPAGALAAEHRLCIAKWPNSDIARWYITISSVLIFALPLAVICFCYYHILNKLREALKSCKRMKRGASSRAPYHRVTRLVLWVVVFHVLSWSPFWLFNLFSSIFRLRISTQFDRIVINIVHLFPYVNCALNPILYVAHAENFRVAFRSLCCGKLLRGNAAQHQQRPEDSRAVGPGGGGAGGAFTALSSVMGPASGSNGNLLPGNSLRNNHNHIHSNRNPTTDECRNHQLRGSASERPLLGGGCAATSACNSRLLRNACNTAGSAPSLLLLLPLRANSAKHSVITLDYGGGVVDQDDDEEGRGCAECGGEKQEVVVSFVSRVINTAESAPKRSCAETCLLLEQPDDDDDDDDATDDRNRQRKSSELCRHTAGIVAGTLMGCGGQPTTVVQEEEDGDEFV